MAHPSGMLFTPQKIHGRSITGITGFFSMVSSPAFAQVLAYGTTKMVVFEFNE
ncbi:hypothetical protein V2A60_009449 [Cordyceps javanica]